MICINSVTVYPSSATVTKGKWYYGAYASIASDCPECAEVEWYSNSPSIASVNKTTGYIYGVSTGTTRIYAEATDGSGKKDYITVTVTAPVAVTGVSVCPTSMSMDVGCTDYLYETIYPSNATNQMVTWCSSDDSVAEVNTYSGKITAKKAGIVTITACTVDGEYSDSCEVWVHGKTPVFLIHGRDSNAKATWGIKTNIPSGANNDFDPSIDAEYAEDKKYIEVDSQRIVDVVQGNSSNDDKPCNLGDELEKAGYTKNINLFVFTYPNQDAVVHSANKFKRYIENLIDDVRASGTDEEKACFYASRSDYENNIYEFNIVAHSMGGLVARYYIENLYQDCRVDKLITICTPHWGSGYANLSNFTGNIGDLKIHLLADHDLDFNSKMFGGSNAVTVTCNKGAYPVNDYELTPTLQYQRQRSTKYYAIAGIDYNAIFVNRNDHSFEMPTNFIIPEEITNFLITKNVYKLSISGDSIIEPPEPTNIGDNVVGFLSQIGWTGDKPFTIPYPKIEMEKIFVDVDANGGNGGETFIWEMILEGVLDDIILHSKIPHREDVINKIIEYLGE
ncbi:MAG: alpha/beta hydrolase [Ruminococcaceae bacterium]|nr:alpha/beta hydrolase [Oscillospiraceae bacterium]